MVEGAGSFLAWLGASLVVLSDGRRGLALGVFLAGGGIALVALSSAGPAGALALAVGGLVAAAGRLVSGRPGWAIMPAGSTPRLVLCLAGGIAALWIGLGVTSGDGASLRFAVLATVGLAGARALGSADTPTVLTAAAVLALAVGGAAGLGGQSPNAAPYILGAAIAAASSWIPIRTPRAA